MSCLTVLKDLPVRAIQTKLLTAQKRLNSSVMGIDDEQLELIEESRRVSDLIR